MVNVLEGIQRALAMRPDNLLIPTLGGDVIVLCSTNRWMLTMDNLCAENANSMMRIYERREHSNMKIRSKSQCHSAYSQQRITNKNEKINFKRITVDYTVYANGKLSYAIEYNLYKLSGIA